MQYISKLPGIQLFFNKQGAYFTPSQFKSGAVRLSTIPAFLFSVGVKSTTLFIENTLRRLPDRRFDDKQVSACSSQAAETV